MLGKLKKKVNQKINTWALSRVESISIIPEPIEVIRINKQVIPYRLCVKVSVFDNDEHVNLRIVEASHKLGEDLLKSGALKKVKDEVHINEPIRTIILEAHVAKEER